jgi:hypothetical protein
VGAPGTSVIDAQAEAREQELAAQAEKFQQEGRFRVRAWKARKTVEADTGLETDAPRTEGCEHRSLVGKLRR